MYEGNDLYKKKAIVVRFFSAWHTCHIRSRNQNDKDNESYQNFRIFFVLKAFIFTWHAI